MLKQVAQTNTHSATSGFTKKIAQMAVDDITMPVNLCWKVKVKQANYRPGQGLRVPES